HPGSFDGRYFGVIKSCSVIGTVMPVWLVSD
ncbi:MAG: S26 family signal peptidase, partial [Hyphomicrobiales bacterium]|nr:S26 family signal peptidase [Hyphomicrobiales bacterium]